MSNDFIEKTMTVKGHSQCRDFKIGLQKWSQAPKHILYSKANKPNRGPKRVDYNYQSLKYQAQC